MISFFVVLSVVRSWRGFLTQRRRGAECAESFMAAARQGTPQRGSGGWPPDIKPCLCVTMKSVLNAKPPLTASAYSATLRLTPARASASRTRASRSEDTR